MSQPAPNFTALAHAIVVNLNNDNNCTFLPTPEDMFRLETVLADMYDCGVEFTPKLLRDIACPVEAGDEVDTDTSYLKALPYYETLDEIVTAIFEGRMLHEFCPMCGRLKHSPAEPCLFCQGE